MRRRSSLLLLGLLATGATAQVAACSSNNNHSETSSSGGGTDSGPGEDATSSGVCPLCCSGALPVMWIESTDGTGNPISTPPDWTCYESDGGGVPGAYARPFVADDAGDDAAVDASDAASPGTDAATTTDAATGTDAGESAEDAGVDSGSVASGDYKIHLVDFSSQQAPIGATVDLFWGPYISGMAVGATRTVTDSTGIITYSPPANQPTLSYHIHPSTDAGSFDQDSLYWYNLEIVPPGQNEGTAGNGQIESNSITTSTASALITAVLGSQPPQANLATLVTAARDCQNRDVTGAQLKLIDSVTGQDVTAGASGPAAPVGFYFLNNIPDTTCTYTNNSGGKAIWSIVNAPVNQPANTHVYTLQMWGRTSTSDPAGGRLITTSNVELYPGGNTVARVYKQGGPPPN